MALSQVINPTTLQRIYDNEFRAMGEEDVLTLPETMETLRGVVWSELDSDPGDDVNDRNPYVSSLRRNLQRAHIDRLIDMSMPGNGMGSASAPVSNLSRMQLREILSDIEGVKTRRLDAYSKAHLAEAKSRIERALDAQYMYNTNDIGNISLDLGGMFMQEQED